ncbi:asparaginase [Desulfobacca acetoxidans]|uniref:L-asparaginase II n=1 Tax=Desulfobacca acetoxidans (strain ATCC 700848 / DSM 11109 / ASRB2) TaxID=880072 RepID=F2ND67_DESAR|nr:asparaginase [Desulfobacca acetoxidans]AEB09791.1 L-asparaginase II [Desulfobacca acetoxidans DSM 11109]
MSEKLVEVTRGARVESIHFGDIAVVDREGRLTCSLGNPDMWVCLRSMAKPIQALPVITTGAARNFGFGDEELALFCGSLNGQDFQVALVEKVLARLGLSVEHLQCGVHAPSHRPTAQAMAKAGLAPSPLHNNCAGKHTAMLALCVHHGWPLDHYLDPGHPVQQLILHTIAVVTETPADQITVAIDGCGAPVFFVPLRHIALAYARFAAAGWSGPAAAPLDNAIKTLAHACLAHPRLIAGDGRICTDIMQALPGQVIAKTGAEGGYSLALLNKGLGVAIKISDGHARGLNSTAVEVLAQLRVLTAAAAEVLTAYHHSDIKNHRKEVVGQIRPAFELIKTG